MEEVKGKKKLFDLTFKYSQKNYRGKTIKQNSNCTSKTIINRKRIEVGESSLNIKESLQTIEIMAAKIELRGGEARTRIECLKSICYK